MLGKRINPKENKVNLIIYLGGIWNINLNQKSVIDGRTKDFGVYNPSRFSGIVSFEFENILDNVLIVGLEPFLKFTPNEFNEFPIMPEAKSNFEAGLTLRIKL